MNGEDISPSGPEMSLNTPGAPPDATASVTERTRLPVRLSLWVPTVTRTSVAANASGGIPTS